MNRRITTAKPHSVGWGTPISHKPRPMMRPNTALIAVCVSKIVAEALGALVQQQRRLLDVLGTREPDEAVADVFFVEQDEDHEDDDDTRRQQKVRQRSNEGAATSSGSASASWIWTCTGAPA